MDLIGLPSGLEDRAGLRSWSPGTAKPSGITLAPAIETDGLSARTAESRGGDIVE